MLNYHTAGESHGKGILALVNGFPAGIQLDESVINRELRRRQGGYGRGGRQDVETDTAEILTGVWGDLTLGGPISLWVKNKDYRLPDLTDLDSPRPGHGDLSGSRKYLSSMRGILERASARETAGRVAAGALARQLLSLLGVEVFGFVTRVGKVEMPVSRQAEELFSQIEAGLVADDLEEAQLPEEEPLLPEKSAKTEELADKLRKMRDTNVFYSLAEAADDARAKAEVDAAKEAGDTVGGVIEIRAVGLPFGLGTHAEWQRKLDGQLAQAVMAVQAIKGVEIGLGFRAAELPGSEAHDAIHFRPDEVDSRTCGFARPTNHAGGLEAGMTNTKPIILRAAMKPIATLKKPLASVNMKTLQPQSASWERSDICAVPATSVVLENVVAFTLAQAIIEKFGGDSLQELLAHWSLYQILARSMDYDEN